MPYVGVIQVAELGRTRAISADGSHWAIQYVMPRDVNRDTDRQINRENANVFVVATIAEDELKLHPLHSVLDADEITSAINQLYQAVTSTPPPFAATDYYEYWLLDQSDKRPLALIQATANADDMNLAPPPPAWVAMPASQLEIKAPEAEQSCYVPPVNYRLQQLIEERAGTKPQAAWFHRKNPAADDFPPCLIREDWTNEQDQQLCDLYIHRLAPRLLMMQGLSTATRDRLEAFASHYVFDVQRFYTLYPEIIDEKRMNAARVEARIRKANSVDEDN